MGGPQSLAPSQEMLWEFMTALAPHDPGAAQLVVVDCRMLHGPLRISALRRAFDDLVTRHDALRLTLEGTGPDPRVVIRERMTAPLELVNLSGRPEQEQRARIEALVHDERQRRFALRTGPLWHAKLIRLAPGRHLMTVCFFHLIADGWSCKVFMEDLLAAYGTRTGCSVPQEPAPSFEEISALQAERFTDREERLAYWRTVLRPVTQYLRFRPEELTPSTALKNEVRHTFALRPPVADSLRRASWRCRTTPYVALLAAYHVLLASWTAEERITIGTTTLGREGEASRRALGQFTNNIYVSARVRPQDSLREVVRAVHRAIVQATEHVSSFTCLARAVHPGFDACRPWPDNHLFDGWFQAAAADVPDLEAHGIRIEQLDIEGSPGSDAVPFATAADVPARALPVWLKRGAPIMSIDDERHGGCVIYNRDFYDDALVARLVENYISIVEAFAQTPDQPVGAVAQAAGAPLPVPLPMG